MEQYLSPFSLIQDVSPSEIDKKALLLAKKKLLAEFELDGGNAVVINGRELTKNDIINFFDGLQHTNTLAYHLIIAQDQVLLRFLQHNVIEKSHYYSTNEFYNHAQFIEWISPYYFFSFSYFAMYCLANRNDAEWNTLLSNPMLMNIYFIEEAWTKIENSVRKDLDELNFFAGGKGQQQRHSKRWHIVEPLTTAKYIGMLKMLPAERFVMLKDQYAYALMQCSIIVFNHINKETANTLVKNALLLAVSANVKESLTGKQAEMLRIYRRVRKSRSEGIIKKIGVGGAVVFVLFMFILGVSGTDDDNSDHNFNNIPAYNVTPGDSARLTLKQLDSIFMDHQKTGDSIKNNSLLKKKLQGIKRRKIES